MYECPKCQHQTVVGVGREPVAFAGDDSFNHYASHSGLELTRGKE
jgi:hypothetical protein